MIFALKKRPKEVCTEDVRNGTDGETPTKKRKTSEGTAHSSVVVLDRQKSNGTTNISLLSKGNGTIIKYHTDDKGSVVLALNGT